MRNKFEREMPEACKWPYRVSAIDASDNLNAPMSARKSSSRGVRRSSPMPSMAVAPLDTYALDFHELEIHPLHGR